MDRDTRATLVSTILFGSAVGLTLFVGEAAVDLVKGNHLEFRFFVVAPPAYLVMGAIIGVFSYLLVNIAASLFRIFRTDDGIRADSVDGLTAVGAVFAQSVIVANELVLAHSPAGSFLSIVVDSIVVMSCLLLYLLIIFLEDKLKTELIRTWLIAGSLLSSMTVSMMYFTIDRPMIPRMVSSMISILIVFILIAVIFTATFWTLRSLSSKSKNDDNRLGFKYGLVIFFICSIVYFLMELMPSYHFDVYGEEEEQIEDRPNVILIVVDTLRADHLSSFGYSKPTSPNIDDFGRESIVYRNCISPANWTPPGHASIFTGKFPAFHGSHKVQVDGESDYPTCAPLSDSQTTLAEILSENGYRTSAIVANFGFVSSDFGLDQGFQFWFASPPKKSKPMMLSLALKSGVGSAFDLVRDPVPYRRAGDIRRVVVDWIDRWGDRPFFLFVNFMDPHSPYSPPGRWADEFKSEASREPLHDVHDGLREGTMDLSEDDWAQIQAQYDGEVAYVDSELGILFRELKERGVFSESIIILTSDHGEFLGEFELLDHQVAVYEPVVRVPLIIKPVAGTGIPDMESRWSQTVDILPTVLEWLDIPIPEGVNGSSLLGRDRHSIVAQHFVDSHIANWYKGRFATRQTALYRNSMKMILAEDGTLELYDLHSDSGEQQNLAYLDGAVPGEMAEEIYDWCETARTSGEVSEVPPALDEATVQRLRSLGYIQ